MLNDGLRSGEDKSELVDTFNIKLTGSIESTGAISGASTGTFTNVVATGSVVATTSVIAASKALSAVGTGSPSLTYGRWCQAGVGATGAGSNAWHVFPTAFAAAPTAILATSAETNEALMVPLGSYNAGSFYVETIGASKSFSYIAIQ